MKKLFAFVLTLIMALSLCACESSTPAPAEATPSPAPVESAAPTAEAVPSDNAAFEAQTAELTALLDDFGTRIQTGSAGSSLRAVAQAARLMDWGMSTGMTDEQISAAAADYLAALDEGARAEYLMQIDSLDYAYNQLLQPGQEELLSDAGCANAAYPWSDSPIPAVESLMTALGVRSAGAEEESVAAAAPAVQSADGAPAAYAGTADGVPAAYAGILEAYYTAVTQQPDVSALPAGVNADLYPFICQRILGFCYYDVNSDGVQELLIGPASPDYSSAWIFDLYTVADGQCTAVFQGWDRNYLMLLSDGTIVNRASSGAGVSSGVFSRLEGGALVPFYSLIVNSTVNSGNPYFVSNGGDMNSDPTSLQSISQQEYEQTVAAYEAQSVTFEYTPITAPH